VTAENFHSGWSDGRNRPMQSPARRKDGCRGVLVGKEPALW
jgi:hypothetical protein